MKGMYKNNFLKQFTLVWIVVVTALIITLNTIINVSFEKIKSNYINQNCALVGAFLDSGAIDKNRIAAVFTQGIKYDDYEKGKETLAAYGYKEDMDIKLVPKVDESYKTLKVHINSSLIFAMIILYFSVLFFYNKIVGYVRRLNQGIKKVVEGDFSLRFSFTGEGPFSILAHNFNQMAERLENSLMELTKEKIFLKDTLANISHQLKTPITSMSLFTEALINNFSVEDEVEKIGCKMRSSLYSMEWLIKKLLKLAKIEGGVVEYNKINISFKATIEKAIEPLLVSIEEKNINVKLKVEEGSYPHDRGWTSEALTNIVKNSIEHTKPYGEVCICYENNPIYHKITISDNGEGIDKEDLPYIFQRFYKGKSSSGMMKSDSIGIGLALAKNIIEGQGGFLQVESIKEEGSKFIVTFLTNL